MKQEYDEKLRARREEIVEAHIQGVTFLLRFAVCSKPDRCSIAVMVLVAGHSVPLFVSSRRARSFRAPKWDV